MINPDSGCYRLLSVATLLDISLQRDQHLVRANYIFFWQLIPPLLQVIAFTVPDSKD